MITTQKRPHGQKESRVKLTQQKARVGMMMPRELYNRMKEAAVKDARTVSNWLVLAALEKLERES